MGRRLTWLGDDPRVLCTPEILRTRLSILSNYFGGRHEFEHLARVMMSIDPAKWLEGHAHRHAYLGRYMHQSSRELEQTDAYRVREWVREVSAIVSAENETSSS